MEAKEKKELVEIFLQYDFCQIENEKLNPLDAVSLASKVVQKLSDWKKEYALQMCKRTVNNIDRTTEWLNIEEQYKQFIPQDLLTKQSENPK